MTRALVTAMALAAFPLCSFAEEASVRFTVRPMPAPKPALKYQLLPEPGELNPGNSAQNYVKCFMEQRNFFFTKESAELRARYLTMPLPDLAALKVVQYGGSALLQADWAARLDNVDWQDTVRVQTSGIERLPAELGPLQILAAALQARFRIEVAARRFDDAIRTAKTMFALGRHLGEHSGELAGMVGLAVAHLSLDTLQEMVQQPGCPNLYWALTDLPSPLVDLRKSVQGDRTLVAAELRPLRDDVPMTDTELETFVGRVSGVISFAREQAGQPPRSLRATLDARVKDPEQVRAAGGRLVEAGSSRDVLKKLGPLQVILLDERRGYEVERDERIKLMALPLSQIHALTGTLTREQGGQGLFADLLPEIVKLRRSQARLEQQIALLRHVEALRLHAAGYAGKLPAKLADFSVPVPDDPVTGKPFVYAVEGGTAHLRGNALCGEETDSESKVHYEVTLVRPAFQPDSGHSPAGQRAGKPDLQ